MHPSIAAGGRAFYVVWMDIATAIRRSTSSAGLFPDGWQQSSSGDRSARFWFVRPGRPEKTLGCRSSTVRQVPNGESQRGLRTQGQERIESKASDSAAAACMYLKLVRPSDT